MKMKKQMIQFESIVMVTHITVTELFRISRNSSRIRF
jgi:hypothetical protein